MLSFFCFLFVCLSDSLDALGEGERGRGVVTCPKMLGGFFSVGVEDGGQTPPTLGRRAPGEEREAARKCHHSCILS